MSETEIGGPYPFEELEYCRIIEVDDRNLKYRRRIYYQTIVDMLEEILEDYGYELQGMEIVDVRFNGKPQKEMNLYRPYRNDSFPCFLLKLEKFGNERHGIYQPFGSQLGIFRTDFAEKVNSLYGLKLQFVINYFMHDCTCHDRLFACRNSRCYTVKKRWFKDELMLKACSDRMISRHVDHKWKDADAKSAFCSGEYFAEKVNKWKAMSLDL